MLTHLINHPLGKRPAKPRQKGITMVLDTGLGLRELQDLLEIAGEYLDYLKLGFGTSLLYQPQLLQTKIKFCQAHQVEIYPGGTLTEIALLQGQYEAYLKLLVHLGFNTIEISDGLINLTPAQREKCIKQASKQGLTVLTELGKKMPGTKFATRKLGKQGSQDLNNGAQKIIIEARESGKNSAIYNQQGEIKPSRLKNLLKHFSHPHEIIWEAPLKKQQIALIHAFGPEVNLGNIHPQNLLAVEALRSGLRADTLILAANFTPQIKE